MKVIDLLNKIANGEEAPKKIKTKNDVWIYDCNDCEGIDYRASDDRGYMFEVHTRINKDDLNEEVEIIEENKKIEKINKLYKYKEELGEDYYENILKIYDGGEYEINEDMSFVIDKINEIIEVINNGNDGS